MPDYPLLRQCSLQRMNALFVYAYNTSPAHSQVQIDEGKFYYFSVINLRYEMAFHLAQGVEENVEQAVRPLLRRLLHLHHQIRLAYQQLF